MKILHVTQGYFPAIGGTELLIQRVSEELVRQFGDEVTVFTTNCYNGEGFYIPHLPRMATGWETIKGVKVRRFPVNSRLSRLFRPLCVNSGLPGSQYFRTLFSGPIMPGLAGAIRRAGFDLLGASSFPLLHMYTALRAAHQTRRPCVLHGGLHPQDIYGFQRPMIYRAILQANHYISNTEFESNYVVKHGISPEKITTIGVGVDLPSFECIDPQEAKQRLGLPGVPLVGFIGQIVGHKGIDTLLQSMSRVWQVVPEARLLVAGSKTLFSATLEQLIRQMPPEAQEKILLRYNFANEEKPCFFAAVDVFAYPSVFESFGIAFLEAWAARKPVIGCRSGAVPWVITAGRDGLLVEYQDQALLAEAIILLLKNPTLARSMGEAGYQKVAARYHWPEVARRFRRVYEDTINNGIQRKH